MALQEGELLNNRYRIEKLLGSGGFGAVYQAWDYHLNAPCAVKENTDISPAAQRQFAREASILANLRHPNLPRVIDHFFIHNRGQYLVMDFIQGEDLESKLLKAGRPLPEAQVVEWINQVCDALTYLHSQNPPVIHRDVKPSNIRITPTGQAVLVDFGIAKTFDPSRKTTQGAVAASPGYSPPEQFGMGTLPQSDIYALGATAYHLLTGKVPPPAMDVVSGRIPFPPPVIAVNPAVSPQVSAAIEKAMQFRLVERTQSVEEFRCAIASLYVSERAKISTPYETTIPKEGILKRFPPLILGALGLTAVGILGILAILVFFIIYVISNLNKTPSPAVAEIPASSILTPTMILTLTPSPPPPPTPTKTARPGFTDNFSNPDSGWGVETDSDVTYRGYEAGAYRMQVFKPNYYNKALDAGVKATYHYRIEVDARSLPGSQGSYGIIFGGALDGSYHYEVEVTAGEVRIEMTRKAGTSKETISTKIDITNANPEGEMNHIMVEVNGATVKAHFNGMLMLTRTINDLQVNARLGVFVCTCDGTASADVLFDNFVFTPLDE